MILLAILFVVTAVTELRWLRVAQREHYLAGSASRFALRWWRSSAYNVACLLLMVACAAATLSFSYAAFGVAIISIVAPGGLSLRGRTAKLAWTRRLRLLAITVTLLWLVAVAVVLAAFGTDTATRVATLFLLLAPGLVDLGLGVTAPVERRIGDRYVVEARRRLARVAPTIVAITGSYGKTTTKGYIAHLLAPHHVVLASPRSFNNRAGLARTVNELLTPDTEVVVAEMGTYGRGEIRELCSWMPPKIAVITAIGPVHLERFKDLSVTLSAKAEIAELAPIVVLNVDDDLLVSLVEPLRGEGKRVITCSISDRHVELCLLPDGDELALFRQGTQVARASLSMEQRPAALANVVLAIAVAMILGQEPSLLLREVGRLPQAPNRLNLTRGESGVAILDDTFNANPAGAEIALSRLGAIGARAGRCVLVTPGMIELGRRQQVANRRFAKQASEVCTDIVIVGRTNRRALRAGAGAKVHLVLASNREEAVAWVRSNLGENDVVLYENDLPDHYA